jgi:beta-galactosidase/beta-glucuronidase
MRHLLILDVENLFDPEKGFMLNGESYPLRGVSRHQDRLGVGNALTRAMHDEDMKIIAHMGANTIRLAHYQHDQYFYDLCDKYGMVVWAEVPYITEHKPSANDNSITQLRELISQILITLQLFAGACQMSKCSGCQRFTDNLKNSINCTRA